MTKPTILILTIVYLASVLIVGIFGMQIMSFNNINYIASITLINDKDHLEFSHNKETLIFHEISKDAEAIPYKEYYLMFTEKVGMTIKITPVLKAIDPTLDPTIKELDVNIVYEEGSDGCITYDNGVYTVNKMGGAIVTYKSKDNSNKKMVVRFIIIPEVK